MQEVTNSLPVTQFRCLRAQTWADSTQGTRKPQAPLWRTRKVGGRTSTNWPTILTSRKNLSCHSACISFVFNEVSALVYISDFHVLVFTAFCHVIYDLASNFSSSSTLCNQLVTKYNRRFSVKLSQRFYVQFMLEFASVWPFWAEILHLLKNDRQPCISYVKKKFFLFEWPLALCWYHCSQLVT